MIEDGHLVHGQIDSSLQGWQPESFVVTGLLLAILATVLSYQSTSLAYDLFFGIKQRGQVAAPDMHMLLLADEGSPLSIAAAVFRHDDFDRARFHGDIPRATQIVRNRARIRRAIVMKLVLVLLAAPFVNLIAVFLTLEREEIVPFSEAKFGSVAFGFDRHTNLSFDFDAFGAKCFRIRTRFSHAAEEHAQFFFCLDTVVETDLEETAEKAELILTALPDGRLGATLRLDGSNVEHSVNAHVDIFTDDQVYRVAQAFSQEDLQALTDEMVSFIEDKCRRARVVEVTPKSEPVRTRILESNVGFQVETTDRVDLDQSVLSSSQTLACEISNGVPKNVISGALVAISLENANLSLVDTGIFRVVNNRDLPVDDSAPDWFDGGGLTLLKRRTNYVPVGILFLVTGVILLFRFVVDCFTNNDVYDGIDEIIARNVGLSNSHALLRSDRLLRYDHKYQRGLTAHYGMPRADFPEVRSFSGGEVGIGNIESPSAYGEEIFNPDFID